MKTKVVVIGGAGFLGSHTADELSRRGYDVTLFDQKKSDWLREDQKMYIGSILDRQSLQGAMKGAKIIYHFAGIADIKEASGRPLDTIQLNVIGTSTVLDVARELGIHWIIFASTMYVYSPHGSFYRASKQSAETIIEAYHEEFGLDYTILRYGSLYGPRAQSWNGLRSYVKQIVVEGRLDYDGSGKERREYIHVKDAARLSVDVLDKEHKNRAITVTGTQSLNSSELLEMIFEIAGIEQEINYIPGPHHRDHYTMTPYRYTPKSAKKLIPEEFIDLGEGILEIVEEIHNQDEASSLE